MSEVIRNQSESVRLASTLTNQPPANHQPLVREILNGSNERSGSKNTGKKQVVRKQAVSKNLASALRKNLLRRRAEKNQFGE